MNSSAIYPTATLLSDGNVLVVSGYSSHGVPQRTAELYDPATGRWTATSDLITARGTLTATLLPNAKVLVAGGETSNHCDQEDKAELYDPATRRWSATGSLTAPRGNHTATLLPNGKVLVAAGMNICNLLNSAEIYDPATGSWSVTRSLITTRIGHTATLLANGEVLVAGGYGTSFTSVASNSAEFFEIKTPQITSASISGKRLFVEGKNFDVGAKIILNDEKQKTANDELTATTLLIGKKAGKRIGLGETVRLKVRNYDGTESAEFSYTRPAQ